MRAKDLRCSCTRGSSSSVSHSMSSDTDLHISDLDSESSKDTVNEKHNHEDREKEKDEDDYLFSGKDKEDGYIGAKKRKTSSTARHNLESRKRLSESSTHDDSPDGQIRDLPRKKRPLSSGSNILDDSIHMPDKGGLNITQLIEHVQTVKKKGLLKEYAHIKMEKLAGTFNQSKSVSQLFLQLLIVKRCFFFFFVFTCKAHQVGFCKCKV